MLSSVFSRVRAQSSSTQRSRVFSARFLSSVLSPGDEGAYDKLEAAPGKKILYFTASWCGPCKRIAPVFDKLSKETPEVSFIKVDVDQLPDAAAAGGIQSVPTFRFQNGRDKVFEFCGADESMLKSQLKKFLE